MLENLQKLKSESDAFEAFMRKSATYKASVSNAKNLDRADAEALLPVLMQEWADICSEAPKVFKLETATLIAQAFQLSIENSIKLAELKAIQDAIQGL